MKKIRFVIPAVALTGILLTGCVANSPETKVVKDQPSMFVKVEDGLAWDVYYHRDTKVMYAVSDGSHNYGTFTVLVNPDGTPMLWSEGEG